MQRNFLFLFLFFFTFSYSLFSMDGSLRIKDWGKYNSEKKAFVSKDENGFEFERSMYQRVLQAIFYSETDLFSCTRILTYDEKRDSFIERGCIRDIDTKSNFVKLIHQKEFVFASEISAIIVGQTDPAFAAYAVCKNIKKRAQEEIKFRKKFDVEEKYIGGKKQCLFEYLWRVYRREWIDIYVRIYNHKKNEYKQLEKLAVLDGKTMNTVLLNVITKNYTYKKRHGKKNREVLTLNPKRGNEQNCEIKEFYAGWHGSVWERLAQERQKCF